MVGTLRSTGYQDSESSANHNGASSDSDASRENVAYSDRDSASGDCLTCWDIDEVTIRTTHKKYRKRIQASCSLDRSSLWSEVQLKWTGDSCQALWGHDQGIIRMEWDCALEEDYNSFEMHKMTVRSDQVLCIAEDTNLKAYTWESEAEPMGRWKVWYCY